MRSANVHSSFDHLEAFSCSDDLYQSTLLFTSLYKGTRVIDRWGRNLP